MKYNKLDLGQIEAIVNKLGGMNGVRKFLSGELVVASSVTSTESISTPTFTYDKTKDGWKLLENVAEAKDIKISDFKMISFLKSGESYINGKEMARRAKELKANLGQQHAEYFLAHQNEIPKEFRKHYLVFPGTVWQRQVGGLYVPCLDWNGSQWYLNFGWFGHDWLGSFRLLSARK